MRFNDGRYDERSGETARRRFEPNVRLTGQAMMGALVLFGMGSQTGSALAVWASAAVALYAVMVPGTGWHVLVSPATWRFAGKMALRLAAFAGAVMVAILLANGGPILGIFGSLAFIGILGFVGFVAAMLAWRLASWAWRKAQRMAGRGSHALEHVWMLARLSIS
jgi:hypothetical protein